MLASTSTRRRFHPASLDALNFLLADVRGALGPYLNVYLVSECHWSQSAVGAMTTIGGLLGLAAQTPIGAAIDQTRAKRGVIGLGLLVLALGGLLIYALPGFWPVTLANSAIAIAGDVFGPAVAALTLGLYARSQLARRMGRNSAFDHLGNIAIAGAAGTVGYAFSQRAVFLLVPVFAALAILAVLSIPSRAIDHARARGLEAGSAVDGAEATAGVRALIGSRPLLIFCLTVTLFHFANAPLLPLVGQKLASAHPRWADAMMSACIVAAQLVMLPVALLSGWAGDRWGRKPVFLLGFGILPLRAWLYTLSDDSLWLVGVQLLDGIGAGIFGALAPVVIADVTRGTGRFNLAQGLVATVQGAGASLSSLVAGVLVDRSGYAAAFLALGAAAAAAFAVFAVFMPETDPLRTDTTAGRTAIQAWNYPRPASLSLRLPGHFIARSGGGSAVEPLANEVGGEPSGERSEGSG